MTTNIIDSPMQSSLDKCLVSLSFDDGRIDNYTIAYPILKKMDMPATFNITTGYVGNKLKPGNPTDVKPMSMDMVKELFSNKAFEIAGHGWAHQNDIKDIDKGFEELKISLNVDMLTPLGDGFASPGTGLNKETWQKLTRDGKHNIRYARVSLRYKSHKMLKTLTRKASRILRMPCLYRMAYQDTLMDSVDGGLLYSIPVLSSITVNELKAVINHAVKTKQAVVLMFHSIVPDGNVHDNWDYESGKFTAFCDFLKQQEGDGRLQVCTSMELWKQLTKER